MSSRVLGVRGAAGREGKLLDAHVVVATRNRARDLQILLTALSQQTRLPHSVTIVGVSPSDVEGAAEHPFRGSTRLEVLLAASAGLCAQRNHGLTHIRTSYGGRTGQTADPFFVAFFDDDYRPANDWLEQCAATFSEQEDVAGLTGHVLADGVQGTSVTEADASAYIEGKRAAERHWAAGVEQRELSSLYGCNMAFRDRVVLNRSFDENLPLYGWQEDRDFTSRAKAFGKTIYTPRCRGVHLGARSGRVSGVRFGYSQVANPIYMWRKGTMDGVQVLRFVSRHLISNSVRTVQRNQNNDYPGRLRGNALALRDMISGACHPTRILAI